MLYDSRQLHGCFSPIERESAHLVNLMSTDSLWGPTHTHGPSRDKPVTTACSRTSCRRHPRPTFLTYTRPDVEAHKHTGPERPEGYPTHKECAVTPEKTHHEKRPKERMER